MSESKTSPVAMYGTAPDNLLSASSTEKRDGSALKRYATLSSAILGITLAGLFLSRAAPAISSSIALNSEDGTDDGTSTDLSLTEGLLKVLRHFENQPTRLLFGHHLSTVSGQFFSDPDGTHDASDVHNASGDWPVVYGGDIDYVVGTKTGDMLAHTREAYLRNGFSSFHWAPYNPTNLQNSCE